MSDPRRYSPPFPRNRDPILEVLEDVYTYVDGSMILEVGSGPGQHARYFADKLPHLRWQPTDRDIGALASIDAWGGEGEGVAPALALDIDARPWPVEAGAYAGALTINVLHMIGPASAQNLLGGVARALRRGGAFVVYDCFTFKGKHVSDSNVRFDAHLRATTPDGRVYPFEVVESWAEVVGLVEPEVRWLPANNQCVVWRKRG